VVETKTLLSVVKKNKGSIFLLISLLGLGSVLLLSSAFADFETQQKVNVVLLKPFNGISPVRQIFIPNKNYLSKIELSFVTLGNPSEDDFFITVHLQDYEQRDIAVKSFAVPKTQEEFDVAFSFSPQKASRGERYSILLEINAPPNTVAPLGSEYDAYPDGEMFLNHYPVDKDLFFFTYSKPPPVPLIISVFYKSQSWLVFFLITSILFWSIGFALILSLSQVGDWVETTLYSLGVGIAFPSVLLYILSFLGIELRKDNLFLISFGLLILALFSGFIWTKGKNEKLVFTKRSSVKELSLLLFFFVLAVTTRIAQANDLLVPSGIDSPSHQRILHNIDQNKEIRLESLYHMGFHANVFFLSNLLGIELPETMLMYGQWLSAISGLLFYALARKLFGDYPLALLSTLVYWFLAPFPAALIAWGRYPFLQGLTLLPLALSFFVSDLAFWRSYKFPVAIILVGLFTSHYSASILFFVTLYIFIRTGLLKKDTIWKDKKNIYAFLMILLPFLILFSVKIYSLIKLGSWEIIFQQGYYIVPVEEYKSLFSIAINHGGWAILLAGGVTLLCELFRKPGLGDILVEWVFILVGVNWLQIFLIGHSATRFTNIIIFLFIPLSVLSGVALSSLYYKNKLGYSMAILIVVIFGAYNISGVINPRNILFAAKDQRAMHWIENNTISESTFLISSYFWDGIYKPEDGGAWVTYLTGRQTVHPKTKEEYRDIEFFLFLEEKQIDYVYIGSGSGGLVNFFLSEPNYDLVYDQEGVLIYAIHNEGADIDR
jgi:hypothetical protein